MSGKFVFFVACVFSIVVQIALSTNEYPEIQSLFSKFELIKQEISEMSESIKSWENKTAQLLQPATDVAEAFSCICADQELLKALADDIQRMKLHQNNISNILNVIAEKLKENFQNNENETETEGRDFSEILSEVLSKQNSLEAVFNLILESGEKQSTAEFVKQQFDELKSFVKAAHETPQELPLHDEHLNCLQNCEDKRKTYGSCETAMAANSYQEGVYLLEIANSGLGPFYAYCIEYMGHIWMVMQRREDGSQNFYRKWHDYKSGFGDVFGEYWIGLERLHALSHSGALKLLIVIDDYSQQRVFEQYQAFDIGNELDGYRLKVDGYVGNATNAFADHNGRKFSTYDRDNDNSKTNCARFLKGAWWYNNTCGSHLNGRYFTYANRETTNGITWGPEHKSLRRVFMAVARADGDKFY